MKESEQRRIFSAWLEEYPGLIFKIIRSYASSKEDQNDLFQEISLQIYRSIPNFQRKSAVTTWLYRIALNTAIKWSMKERKHVDGHQDLEKMGNVLESRDEIQDDRLLWLYEQIKQFNEIDRSLTLLLLEGFSYKEMATMIGISESNIGVKIHRIKKQLVSNSKTYEYGV